MVQKILQEVTDRIIARSRPKREDYLRRIEAAAAKGPQRRALGCANQAHGFAACAAGDKAMLRAARAAASGL